MTRIIKRLTIMVAIIFALVSPAYASELYLFDTNIDNDVFQADKISFGVPETINENWYPLRRASEYLPITVDWDNDAREIVIYSDAVKMLRPLCAEQRYNSKRLEMYKDDVKIIDGVTYCSPRFLQMFLPGAGFSYEDSIFCYVGESQSTSYINSGNSIRFRSYVNTSLYELYLKCPTDYRFIKVNLPGGISYINSEETPYWYALGYVYPYSSNPVCYIVGDRLTGATLSSVIAHEAMHVYQARIGVRDSEQAAEQYEAEVLNKLLLEVFEMNKQPVYYLQTSSEWKNVDYSAPGESTTIGASGCGPTSAAMLIETLTGKTYTPVDACKWSLSHGYKAVNQGTYYSYFKPQFAAFGIDCRQLNGASVYGNPNASVHAEAFSLLKQGYYLIACMGKGLWTSSGHYIVVWWEDGKVRINDPASTRTERLNGDLQTFKSQVKYYWAIDAREYNKEPNEEEDDDMDVSRFKELWLEMRKELQDNDSSEYSDAAKKWITEDIKLFEGGGTAPDGKPNYMWEDLMTREQFATVLYRFAKAVGLA